VVSELDFERVTANVLGAATAPRQTANFPRDRAHRKSVIEVDAGAVLAARLPLGTTRMDSEVLSETNGGRTPVTLYRRDTAKGSIL